MNRSEGGALQFQTEQHWIFNIWMASSVQKWSWNTAKLLWLLNTPQGYVINCNIIEMAEFAVRLQFIEKLCNTCTTINEPLFATPKILMM